MKQNWNLKVHVIFSHPVYKSVTMYLLVLRTLEVPTLLTLEDDGLASKSSVGLILVSGVRRTLGFFAGGSKLGLSNSI